jgi:hypothetical protein
MSTRHPIFLCVNTTFASAVCRHACFCCCTAAGTVSGVQASIQSFFEICSFIAGIVVHQPHRFHWLMLASCVSVAAAAGLYFTFVCRGSGSARSLHDEAHGFQSVFSHASHGAASARHGYDSIDVARRESARQ